MSFFNTAGNWGSGAAQIGPGTTVHLCGTFNAPAGADGLLKFQGGGTAGNPVTLAAEPGTLLQAPYWGEHGAITSNAANNIVIDGKGNGTIQATANGTKLANQAPNCGAVVCSSAIHVSICDNCSVQNWTIGNIYVNAPPNDETAAGEGSFGIFFNSGNNISMSGNTVHDAKWCVFFGYYPGVLTQNAKMFGNTIYHCDHGVAVYSDNSGAQLDGLYIYGNTIHDGANWDDNADGNHHDGIHVSPVHSGTSLNNVNIYNNYIYGDWGFNCNSMVYVEAGPETITNAKVFNNLLVNTSAVNTCANGLIQDYGARNTLIANNTLIGSTVAAGQGMILEEDSPAHAVVTNNILANFENGVYVAQGNSLPTSDYNIFYNVANVAFVWGTPCCTPLAEWRTQAGSPDLHSSTANPNLSSSYVPQSGSSAILAGVNLNSAGILALNSDRVGAARPSAGPWDIGAFTSGSVGPPPPSISVSVTPTALSMAPAMQQQFIASVSGSTAGVAWSLSPQMGTLSPSGMYTAPSTIAARQQVSITAAAMADPNANATALVTLTPPSTPTPGPIRVAVSPTSKSLGQGGQQQFNATVTGSAAGVKWSFSPLVGTLSASGMYTAPAKIAVKQVVQVKATSVANPAASATATVTLTPPVTVRVSPSAVKLSPGAKLQFTATVQGSNAGVTWTLSPRIGTVSASGLYTAPSSRNGQNQNRTVQVKATVVGSSPPVSAQAVVTLTP